MTRKVDFAAAVGLYQSGLSMGAIAKHLGVSRGAIWWHFKTKNVPLRDKSTAIKLAYEVGRLLPRQSRAPIGALRRMANGYIRVYQPDHPEADANGYVAEHRLVAETMIGRRLLDTEDVHHYNHVRDDNRPGNLFVIDKAEHTRQHWMEVSVETKAERMRRVRSYRRKGLVTVDMGEGK